MTHETDNIATPLTTAREDGFGGVHDPSFFHDGCGVACVARLDGKAIHETIDRALVALDRLEHRGAAGADESTGDGAGIMFGLPHEFFRSRTAEIGTKPVDLPGPGKLAVAMCFLRRDSVGGTERIQRRTEELVAEAGPSADRLARRSRSTRPPAASSRASRRRGSASSSSAPARRSPTKRPSSAACSSSAVAPSAIAAPTCSSRASPAGPSSTRGC